MAGLHANHYADAMTSFEARLLLNEQVAESTYRLRIAVDAFAERFRPGQFVMIRLADVNAPLIGRPLAVYDVQPNADGGGDLVDLVYLRKGTLTVPLSQSPLGTRVSGWGPLGNGFSDRRCDTLVMAVGGIGQTPMLVTGRDALARGWARRVELIYGARRASLLAGLDDFSAAGFAVTTCTDDGSAGLAARVPDVLSERLKTIASEKPTERVRVLTCGPEVMMQKVADICLAQSIDCQASMETPMACGIGICFSCVAKINQSDGSWDYKRTCVEGPIFDAADLCWD